MTLALAKSAAPILVPVLREQRIPAWPRSNDERAPKVDYQPLEFALLTEHATDAHTTAYSVPLQPYRLNKSAPETLKGGVRMVLGIFDVDGPNHEASDEWWSDQGENLARLNEAVPDLYVYRTRGGYRIVGRLAEAFVIKTPDDAKAWTDKYLQWCTWLWRCFEIKADPVGDWQRLYRLPVVKRDGKVTRYATLGDAGNVGVWSCAPSAADIETAQTLRRKPASDKPKGTAKVRSVTSNYTGSGILVRVLQNRGDLGHEVQPGMWAIRCPRATEHSSGSDFDTSAVVFAPTNVGDELGWIDCKHTNCGHFDKSLKDWLRCFDQTELDRAREQLGIPVQKPQPKPDNDSYEYRDEDAPDSPPDGSQQQQPQAKATIEIVESAAIFAELEEPDWLIDGVIRRGSLVELVGYGSSGKSWIAIDALLSVAAGGQWLGRFNTKQGAALGLDWENGLYEMRRRIQAVAKARQVWDVAALGVAPMPTVYMSDPKFGNVVESLAASRSLIVIDTLKAATPGVDENDSGMRGGLDALRRVGEKTNCAFLVLVHSKKTSGSLTAIDAREAGRGSSAIFDAADSVLHVTYTEGEPLRVQQTKSRQGRQVEPFQVTIEDGELGAVSVSAKDAPKSEPQSSRVAYAKVCNEVLEIVKESPGSSGRVIRARIKCRPGVVSGALETLESNGAIRNSGTESKPKWFATGRTASIDDEWADVAE